MFTTGLAAGGLFMAIANTVWLGSPLGGVVQLYTDGLTPDFARRAVAARDLPGAVRPGQEYSFTLTDLDLTSLGAPTTRTATVSLGGSALGAFDVVPGVDDVTFGPAAHVRPLDGRVDITVSIPADAPAGETALTVVTDTGTVITVPVRVEAPVPATVG